MSGVDAGDRLSRRQAGRVLRRAAARLVPYRRLVAGASVLVVVSTAAVLAGPLLVRYGIDHGIRPGDTAALDRSVIAYVAVALAAYVASRLQVLLVSRAGEGFLRDLREGVFEHLVGLSMPFFDREKAGVVVARMTADIDSLQELVQMGLIQMVSSCLLIVGSLVVLAAVSPTLLAVCLVPLPLVVAALARAMAATTAPV